jgi:hypothetical protein
MSANFDEKAVVVAMKSIGIGYPEDKHVSHEEKQERTWFWQGFRNGARYQHEKDRARIEELEQIEKVYHMNRDWIAEAKEEIERLKAERQKAGETVDHFHRLWNESLSNLIAKDEEIERLEHDLASEMESNLQQGYAVSKLEAEIGRLKELVRRAVDTMSSKTSISPLHRDWLKRATREGEG